MPIQYLKDLLAEFIIAYPEFAKIKSSVGLTHILNKKLNQSDLPLILIEEINVSVDAYNVSTEGELTFQLAYTDMDSKENGYVNLDLDFTNKFISFLCSNRNEINIENVSYFVVEDMQYAVAFELTTIYTFETN